MDFLVLPAVEIDGQDACENLAQHGGQRCACNAHIKHKDEDGVEDDVENSTQALGNHGIDGAAGGGKQTLQHHLAEQAKGHAAHDHQVIAAILDDILVCGLGGKEDAGTEQTEQQEKHIAAGRNEYAVQGHLIGTLVVLCAQRTGNQRVHTHGAAGGEADHQVLGREGQGNCVEGFLADHADEDAVHDVVQRLHQHGNNDGQRHAYNQLADGHYAHFVFFYALILHILPLMYKSI